MYYIDKDEIKQQLASKGIDVEHIKSLHVKLQTGELDHNSFIIEKSRLKPPTDKDVDKYVDLNGLELKEIGSKAIQQDQLLIFWLNGGAATRYFDETKIKPEEAKKYKTALDKITPAMTKLPKGVTTTIDNMSYLELKIKNLLKITKDCELEHHPHVILMNSFITDEKTREHLNELFNKYSKLESERFHFLVQQPTIPRFQKVEDLKNIDLFVDSNGNLSYAPCGHGDFIYLLQSYLKTTKIPKAKYMFFANIDNLGSAIDPVILGYHIQNQTGRTVELADKNPGDKGGAPCFVNNELLIVEQMKFPDNFNQDAIPWFNTNTFWFTLEDLVNYQEDLPLILAEKNISAGEVIQLEHFACDVNVPSKYLVVPRLERFWPIKRYVDLLIYQDKDFDDSLHLAFNKLLKTQYQIEI